MALALRPKLSELLVGLPQYTHHQITSLITSLRWQPFLECCDFDHSYHDATGQMQRDGQSTRFPLSSGLRDLRNLLFLLMSNQIDPTTILPSLSEMTEVCFCIGIRSADGVQDYHPRLESIEGLGQVFSSRVHDAGWERSLVESLRNFRTIHFRIEIDDRCITPETVVRDNSFGAHLEQMDNIRYMVSIFNQAASLRKVVVHIGRMYPPSTSPDEPKVPWFSLSPRSNLLTAFECLHDRINLEIRGSHFVSRVGPNMYTGFQEPPRKTSTPMRLMNEQQQEEVTPGIYQYCLQLIAPRGESRSKVFAMTYSQKPLRHEWNDLRAWLERAFLEFPLARGKIEYQDPNGMSRTKLIVLIWRMWDAHRAGDKDQFEYLKQPLGVLFERIGVGNDQLLGLLLPGVKQ